jgi:coenzyme PQQ precursor peptide PqqA
VAATARRGGSGASKFNNPNKFKAWFIVSNVAVPIDEEAVMKWTKPEFKTLELASEVTAYRYAR